MQVGMCTCVCVPVSVSTKTSWCFYFMTSWSVKGGQCPAIKTVSLVFNSVSTWGEMGCCYCQTVEHDG